MKLQFEVRVKNESKGCPLTVGYLEGVIPSKDDGKYRREIDITIRKRPTLLSRILVWLKGGSKWK